MANDIDITGIQVGPVLIARGTERKPETANDRHWRRACWAFALVMVVTVAAPIAAVALILGGAVVLAALTAPAQPTDKGTKP